MHPSLTLFMNAVWNSPRLNNKMNEEQLVDLIYDMYTPPPESGPERWFQTTFHALPLSQMGWRVYVSTTSTSMLYVWSVLLPLFQAQQGVVAAKHTTPEAAVSRLDTIVVYLQDQQAKDVLINAVRRLFVGPPSQGNAPPIPPRLSASHFKNSIPPTTAAIEGIPGFAHAQQPMSDGWDENEDYIPERLSFGMLLSSLLASAYLAARSLPEFTLLLEKEYLKAGIDPERPWQYMLNQSQRDLLARSGHAARAKRGY